MSPQVESLFHQLADFTLQQRTEYYALQNVDGDVRDELERLFSFDTTTPEPLIGEAIGQVAARVTAEIEETIGPGSRFGPYRLMAALGEGGMGAVYRAERVDGEMTQEVAIKLVKGGMNTRSMLLRFRSERQILARLEHPNIARLLDGGTTAPGVPYLVMEYIRGRPITAYCAEKKLGVRARLALFCTVCDAVQYAHGKLVIHRDLKPSNVLVTEEGTVKLLDFGIAKVLTDDGGRDGAQTEAPLFTPDYCSPEQIRGEPVSIATDVYALGCLLYELLTEKRPHNLSTYSTAELVEAICAREPARLSDAAPAGFQRALRGDLETIVGRALMKASGQRYQLVDLLRRDIESYLAGHPIMARPQTTLYRARKFVQRNRLPVAVALVATVLLIGTTVLAVHQAAQSRARFNQVRKMARTFIFEFNDELQRVPGNTKATALLVSTASEYLDNLARSAGDDRSLLLELAEAYERLATVQGGSVINLEQRTAALDNRRRAVELRFKAGGNSVEENVRLVSAAGRITNDLKDLGRLDEAVAAGRRAVELSDRLLKDAPTRFWADMAMVHVYLGRALRRRGDLVEASAELEKSEKLLAASTGDSAPRLTLLARWDRASLLAHLGLLEQAAQLLESLDRDIPAVVATLPPGRFREATVRLAPSTWAVLGQIYDNPIFPSLDDPVRSLAYRDKLCGSWKDHLERDRNDMVARGQLANCLIDTAYTRMKVNPAQALSDVRSGVEILDGSEGTPGNTNVKVALAAALLQAGQTTEARIAAAEAIQRYRDGGAANSTNPEFKAEFLFALVVRARVERAAGDPAEGRRAADEAAQLGTPLAGSLDLRVRRAVGEAYAINAEFSANEERCQWRRKALSVWENWSVNNSSWVARQKQDATVKLARCADSRTEVDPQK